MLSSGAISIDGQRRGTFLADSLAYTGDWCVKSILSPLTHHPTLRQPVVALQPPTPHYMQNHNIHKVDLKVEEVNLHVVGIDHASYSDKDKAAMKINELTASKGHHTVDFSEATNS
jgi:hypothetical protein